MSEEIGWRFWGCFAAQREQAPSPQRVVSYKIFGAEDQEIAACGSSYADREWLLKNNKALNHRGFVLCATINIDVECGQTIRINCIAPGAPAPQSSITVRTMTSRVGRMAGQICDG